MSAPALAEWFETPDGYLAAVKDEVVRRAADRRWWITDAHLSAFLRGYELGAAVAAALDYINPSNAWAEHEDKEWPPAQEIARRAFEKAYDGPERFVDLFDRLRAAGWTDEKMTLSEMLDTPEGQRVVREYNEYWELGGAEVSD